MPAFPSLSNTGPEAAEPDPAPLPPGLIVLQGNRLETLGETVFGWLQRHRLGPLEPEVLLVQSNGMAEWIKMALAEAHGVCAATQVELPARFLWRAYRAVLGADAVPSASPMDKGPLTWRLMRLLPELVDQPEFGPVAGFLDPGGASARMGQGDPAAAAQSPTEAALRRLQLAQRLADLLDQYQVHRADWLADWAQGRARLSLSPVMAGQSAQPVPPDQAWQPALWRRLEAELAGAEREASRSRLHSRFVQALNRSAPAEGGAPRFAALPRRVVLFGAQSLPQQTLEALLALSRHLQVLIAVPNPCQFHWADTIDGRELLRQASRRQALRGGQDLAAVPLADMHAHGHPLLGAWGRQARDFVRLLDAQAEAAQTAGAADLARWAGAGLPRIDLFDEAPAGQGSLLEQLQRAIRDLTPLAEQRQAIAAQRASGAAVPDAADRSIAFHITHGPQREVEVLHDQLLQWLAQPDAVRGALQPRDIVVMVPDIDAFAPHIRAVFGQIPRSDPRHIPFAIADQRERGRHPIALALEWLLKAPLPRATQAEVMGLLEVPAVAAALGLEADELPTLAAWVADAGVRWGLNERHRSLLGLGGMGEANSWAFGLDRLLLGYASGEGQPFAGIEPSAEVGGLSAALAGVLAALLDRLNRWWARAVQPRRPLEWAAELRALMATWFQPEGADERSLMAALDSALTDWLDACDAARFDEPVPLAIVREAWLGALDAPGLGGRFKAGGVTFCTLLPLRSIPFEVVALLGMNEGDYPRRSTRSDFDLMALPGLARAGDRSRRDDDRQLMLDALLSARRALLISWTGRSARDQSEQPPSVLVGQLRDHLSQLWGQAALDARTTEHALQPFSRRYFEGRPPLPGEPADGWFTHAREWRVAHEPRAPSTAEAQAQQQNDAATPATSMPLTLTELARFVRNPVAAFFQHRLRVRFDDLPPPPEDDEPFELAGLQRYAVGAELLARSRAAIEGLEGGDALAAAAHIQAVVEREASRLQRAGRLPLGAPGRIAHAELLAGFAPALATWRSVLLATPQALPKRAVALAVGAADGAAAVASGEAPPGHGAAADAAADAGSIVGLQDWLLGLRAGSGAEWPAATDPTRDPTTDPAPPPCPLWVDLRAGRVGTGGAKPTPSIRPLAEPWVRLIAAAATGEPVAGVLIGTDGWLWLPPPDAPTARRALQTLMQAWHRSITGDAQHAPAPLPAALLTGTAELMARRGFAGVPADAAQIAFEGDGFSRLPPEGQEPCLARLFPDFEALAADPGYAATCEALYGDMVDWFKGVSLQPHGLLQWPQPEAPA